MRISDWSSDVCSSDLLDVHRCELAAVVDFDVESDAVAFFEAHHAGALDRADVDKGIGLSVVARDKAKALRRVEEFDRARGAFTGQLAPAAGTARRATGASSEARRVGKGCVRSCSCRWGPDH